MNIPVLEPDGLWSRHGGEEMSEKDCKYVDLSGRFTTTDSKIETLKTTLDSVVEALEGVKLDGQSSIDKLGLVKSDLEALSTKVDSASGKLDALDTDFTHITAKQQTLVGMIEGIESDIGSLTTITEGVSGKLSDVDSVTQSTSATVELVQTSIEEVKSAIEDLRKTCDEDMVSIIAGIAKIDQAVNGTVDERGVVITPSISNRVEDLESRYLRTVSDVELFAKQAAEEKTETLILATTLQDTVSSCEGLVDAIEDLKSYYFNSVEAQIRDAKYGWILKCAAVGIAGLVSLGFLWKTLKSEKRESAKERFYE